jgi:transposase-like protein
MADLKTIYTAVDEQTGLDNLTKMEEKWWKKYYYVFKSWRENWSNLATFFVYPTEIRRIIYTTNVIENFNRWLRKYTKTKVIFPNDSSLLKSLYLAQRNITRNWTWKTPNWWNILSQFQIYFDWRI